MATGYWDLFSSGSSGHGTCSAVYWAFNPFSWNDVTCEGASSLYPEITFPNTAYPQAIYDPNTGNFRESTTAENQGNLVQGINEQVANLVIPTSNIVPWILLGVVGFVVLRKI